MRKQKKSKNEIDIERELVYATDSNWENYCGACDYFDTDECPHQNHVDDITNWKLLRCDKFWD